MTFITSVGARPPPTGASCVLGFANSLPDDGRPGVGDRAVLAEPDEALDLLVADLPIITPTELRTFVGRHAFDAVEPRAAVLPLVRLWKRLERADAGELGDAVEDARRHTSSSRLARDVIDRILTPPVTAAALANLVERFGSLQPGGQIRALERINYAALDGDPTPALRHGSRCEGGTVGAQIFAQLARALSTAQLAKAGLDSHTTLRLVEARPDLIVEEQFWPRDDVARAALTRLAARLNVGLETVAAIVGDAPGPRALAALAEGWIDAAPARIVAMLEERGADGRTSASSRTAITSYLGQSPEILGRAVDAGARLALWETDEVAAAALSAGTAAYLCLAQWEALCAPDRDLSIAPHYAAVIFAAGLVRNDSLGTDVLLRAFPPLATAAAKYELPRTAESHIKTILRSAGVASWSMADGIVEAATIKIIEGGTGYEGLLAAVVERRQLDAMLDTVHRARGGSALQDIVRAAQILPEGGGWKAERVGGYLKAKKKPSWFW